MDELDQIKNDAAQEQEQVVDDQVAASAVEGQGSEPADMATAMFGDLPPEGQAEEASADGEDKPDAHAETAEAKPDDKPKAETEGEAEADDLPDDLKEPEGLSEKASERFQSLANEVKEYRQREAEWQSISEGVQAFQSVVAESCNNSDEVMELMAYAKAVKNGDWATAKAALIQQVRQYEAMTNEPLNSDLLGMFPDLQEGVSNLELDEGRARELAAARYQQQQQQAFVQKQQAAAQSQYSQQQDMLHQQQLAQQEFDQAQQQVGMIADGWAKSDLNWEENSKHLLQFIKLNVNGKLPPNQWVPAITAFYQGLSNHKPAPRVPAPLRSGAPQAGAQQPQSLEDAMFGDM